MPLYSQVSIKRAARFTTYVHVVKRAARLIETWEYELIYLYVICTAICHSRCSQLLFFQNSAHIIEELSGLQLSLCRYYPTFIEEWDQKKQMIAVQFIFKSMWAEFWSEKQQNSASNQKISQPALQLY